MENKTIMVIGASSDIGMQLIREIYHEYDVVIAHYRTMNAEFMALKEVVGNKLVCIQADLSVESQIYAMLDQIEQMGYHPDHIVHLAAEQTDNQKFHKMNWQTFGSRMDVSIKSIVIILQKLIPYMLKQKYGRIVFMLTSYTVGIPPKYQTHYVTEKYALLGLMKSLAVEYKEKGIMVNAVSPQMVNTKFLSNLPSLVVEQNAMNMPKGKNLEVEEIIPTIRKLLHDEEIIVTGENILIDGGQKEWL